MGAATHLRMGDMKERATLSCNTNSGDKTLPQSLQAEGPGHLSMGSACGERRYLRLRAWPALLCRYLVPLASYHAFSIDIDKED